MVGDGAGVEIPGDAAAAGPHNGDGLIILVDR
jgi:hypothetical protein